MPALGIPRFFIHPPRGTAASDQLAEFNSLRNPA